VSIVNNNSPCNTLCGLTSQKTHQGGLGLGRSVHEEAHRCFPCFVQPPLKALMLVYLSILCYGGWLFLIFAVIKTKFLAFLILFLTIFRTSSVCFYHLYRINQFFVTTCKRSIDHHYRTNVALDFHVTIHPNMVKRQRTTGYLKNSAPGLISGRKKAPASTTSSDKTCDKAQDLPACSRCGIVIGRDTKALQCDKCSFEDSWKCIECLDIQPSTYDFLISCHSCDLRWFCKSCDDMVM